jgi:ABC-2 type transport system permease protein
MRKALIVARWEFITTVTRGAFIFAVVAMPLFYGGMLVLAGLAGRSAATSNSRAPVAVVDGAHVIDLAAAAERAEGRNKMRDEAMDEMIAVAARRSAAAAALAREAAAPTTPLVPYSDMNRALDDLRAHKVATVFALDANYLANGLITTYSRDGGLFSQSGDRQRQNQVADAIRASLLQPALSGDALDRAYAPATNVKRMVLDRTGQFHQSTDTTGLGPIAGSFGIFMLLTMAIFFSAGFLQQATIADRQNKMIEILWSSVEPDQLVLGKLVGLGGAGLLQVGVYLALVILPGAALFSLFQVPLLKLLLSVIFFVLGFLVFACLMTGTGMIGRTAQESAQLSTIWILFAAAPWFFIANIGAAPNGLLARALSFFPLTSPIAMMMRLSSVDVALPEVLAVIAVDILAIYLIFRGAAKIFRASALMYGKRPTLPDLVRWLRAA